MKARKFGWGAVFLLGLLLASSPLLSKAFAQASCYRPLCTDGSQPIYLAGQDGTNSGGPYGVCTNGTHGPGSLSHSLINCPAGSTLVSGAGLCRNNACGGGGCEERGICTDPHWPYYMPGNDGRDASGPTAGCSSDPQPFTNAMSHIVVHCPSGFNLVEGVGVCRRCPLIMAPGGVSTHITLRPDLVIRSAWLRTQASPAHVNALRRGTPYFACFTVANVGSAGSGPFRVGAGGLGMRVAPYQDHAGLAVGASRDGCIPYATTPPPGRYALGVSADSLRAVAESREDNNDATIPVIVIP